MMWALYFRDPVTDERYACTSTRQGDYSATKLPALFAQRENLEKVLRSYRPRAYRWVESPDGGRPTRVVLPGADDRSNYLIVPCQILPLWDDARPYGTGT